MQSTYRCDPLTSVQSFCCALSDVATEVLALGCPSLTHLNLAFCGSAVSDSSMRSLGLHLLELRELSVRGCVRVTGVGVEAVVEGCHYLEVFDVSQCKNLGGWLEKGGVQRVGGFVAGTSTGGGSVARGSSSIGSASGDMMSIESMAENGAGDGNKSTMDVSAERSMADGLDGASGGVGSFDKRKIRFEVVADGRWRAGKY